MTTARRLSIFWIGAPVLIVLYWAGEYSFAKLRLPSIEPMTFLAVRCGLAVLCLLPMLALFRAVLPGGPTRWVAITASGYFV